MHSNKAIHEVVGTRERLLRYALVGAAMVVCFLTGVRPFVQGMARGNDFDFLTRGAQALETQGPYHFQLGVVYPPGALAVVYPLRSLPVHAGAILNLLLGILLCGMAVWYLGRALPDTHTEPRRLVLVVMALLWAPLLSGLHSDNVSVPLIGILLLLCSDELLQTTWAMGLLLGVTLAMKPQLGFLFLLFLVMRRRWMTMTIATVTAASLTAWGVILIGRVEPHWIADYAETQRYFNGPGQWADVTYSATQRYVLMNLQVAIYPWIHSVALAQVLGMAVGGVLVAAWVAIELRGARRNDRLALASLLPIALVAVYQQFYNGALLLICLSAVLMLRRSRAVWIAFALLALFLVRPAPFFHHLPARFLNGGVASPLWNSLGVGFSACLTLAVEVAMLWLYWRWTLGKESLLAIPAEVAGGEVFEGTAKPGMAAGLAVQR